MISSAKLISLIEKPNRGAVKYHLDQATKDGGTPKQRQFLADLYATPAPETTVYQHPENKVDAAVAGSDAHRTEPLTPTELAWLQRLPADPRDITPDDAIALGTLARTISPMRSPMDAKLVDSYWQPVKRHHDTEQAKTDIANADRAKTEVIPSTALGALVEAIAAEKGLTPQQAHADANDALMAALTRRRNTFDKKTLTAQQRLATAN